MATKRITGTVLFRRDNDYNYAKKGETFIPDNGEVCLVDTAKKGLCVIIGDGVSNYNKLVGNGYANDIFVRDYYYNPEDEKFYKNYKSDVYTDEVEGNSNRIYIDKNNPNNIYCYNGYIFIQIGGKGVEIPLASSEAPGILKLYDTTGFATDGAMTQRATTEELHKKVSASVVEGSETIIFSFG